MKKLWQHPDIKWGLIILSFYLCWALGWLIMMFWGKGTWQTPYTPIPHIEAELVRPLHPDYWLGTDIHGRSLLETLSMGLIYSLGISLSVSLSAATIGTFVGYLTVAGPKIIKILFEIFTNVIFVFPSILVAIIIMSFFGNSSWGLIAALVFTGWASYARIARGEVKRILGLPYIEAAQAIGMGRIRLFFSGILPGILPQILVHVVLGLSGVILSESALSFLGLGGSQYSWGGQLSMGKMVLLEAPYLTISVSLMMAGFIIGLNLLGDGLRDLLDPKMRQRDS